MSNTPLNADDELDRYLFDTWNMKDTVHNRVLANNIKRWRKKHELQARIDELESLARSVHENTGARGGASIRGFNTAVRYYGENIKSRIVELKQELEKL